MSNEPHKVILQKQKDRVKVPAKPTRSEEIKRISDLLETLSKRVRQLEPNAK